MAKASVKIEILQGCSGRHPKTGMNFSYSKGQIVSVDKELAAGLGSLARPVVSPKNKD